MGVRPLRAPATTDKRCNLKGLQRFSFQGSEADAEQSSASSIVNRAANEPGIDPSAYRWPAPPHAVVSARDASGPLWAALGEALEHDDLDEAKALYALFERRVALAVNGV
jgi:hypothetical protein